MTAKRLSDLIIEHGPVSAGDQPPGWMPPTATAWNELRDELIRLRSDVTFWREQQKLAADVVAGLADLNDHDQRVASLRKLLRGERERRKKAEHEATVLAYKLGEATGTLP